MKAVSGKKLKSSFASVCEQTMLTERLPPVSKVIANFCG
jgi:hypothetical protein